MSRRQAANGGRAVKHGPGREPAAVEGAADGDLTSLLEHLKATRGFDFTGYKRPSLERRLRRRLEEIDCGSYVDYIDYLEVHPDEFAELFNTILINVTGFFRDQPSWDYLRDHVVPSLIESKDDEEPIRIWSAGTASGQEGYSIAILLAEALGEQGLKERVKIYATDVDEAALDQARQAAYSARETEGLGEELRERYFERTNQGYTFRQDLRRSVIFGRNDLVQDAPISRVDLLLCRNTLMYFNVETQTDILRRFHFALRDHGYLFLGKSEMLITRGDFFVPVELKRRIFTKVERPAARKGLAILGDGAISGDGHRDDRDRLRELAFHAAPVAQLILDTSNALVSWNQEAGELFGLGAEHGRPLQDLELSFRPVELRPAIERAASELRPCIAGRGEIVRAGAPRILEAVAAPIRERDGSLLGVRIAYHDLTEAESLRAEADQAKHELEHAYEELQSTVEELETTNEELQSTNEELETTNEELQSTNEELETMNQELQANNEELETTNEELRDRTLELGRLNSFLEAILKGVGKGVIVLDREQRVRAWNEHSEELWGARQAEVAEQPFLSLDIGLPVSRLSEAIHACMTGKAESEELTVEATNRRGRPLRCEIRCVPLSAGDGAKADGVILLIDAVGA